MRLIKFRGKGIDNGKWVYGNLLNEKGFSFIIDTSDPHNTKSFPIDPESVGQYIGLKDDPPDSLKRTEIYDGDIIRLYTYFDEEDPEQSECTVHKVEYQLYLDYPGFDLVPYGDWECNGFGWAIADTECAGFEIIGNMTDNPEVLQNEK